MATFDPNTDTRPQPQGENNRLARVYLLSALAVYAVSFALPVFRHESGLVWGWGAFAAGWMTIFFGIPVWFANKSC